MQAPHSIIQRSTFFTLGAMLFLVNCILGLAAHFILASALSSSPSATLLSTQAQSQTRTQTDDSFQSKCEAFLTSDPGWELQLSFILDTYPNHTQSPHAITRNIVSYIPANTILSLPDNDPSCSRPSQLVPVDICRVALLIPTSHRSRINFELWMPSPEMWEASTRRFLGTGNGGVDGCIKYEDLAYGVQNRFATMGTNNGHNGTTCVDMYGNEDVVVDFSWRALHTGVQVGKALTNLFYAVPSRTSYYIGCSLGGRMGIKSAEKFPDDFDGIIAGAPALDFNNLVSWRAHFYPITGSRDSADFITEQMWTGLIHSEVLRQCDGIDGVVDGIIEDPTLCHFRAEDLLCSNSNSATTETGTRNCLSAVQVETVKTIFSSFYAAEGKLIYPSMQPGSELEAVKKLYAGMPFAYSESWFRYVVHSNPSWDASTFSLHDAALAESLNPANIKTWPTASDLRAFRSRGGKIITYHGQQDNQITSFNTPRWYDHLLSTGITPATDTAATTTTTTDASEPLDSWLRFFRISGMFHCSAGPGAWAFGQGGGAVSANGIPFESSSSSKNVLKAIVDWVEDGIAPDTITGTKFVDDDPVKGVAFRRRHCRYPLKNVYIGGESGDPYQTESWECRFLESQ